MKLKINVFILFTALMCLSLTIFAQDKSEKPFQKWSKDHALKILTESAWAKTYQSTEGSAGAASQQVAREQGQNASSGGSNPRSVARNFGPPPVVIRLHSALPVRQALIRMQQISNGYDKMDENKN